MPYLNLEFEGISFSFSCNWLIGGSGMSLNAKIVTETPVSLRNIIPHSNDPGIF